jgi:hypothetical protein
MAEHTVPGGLLVKLAADLLHARVLRLEQQLAHPDAAEHKAASRRKEVAHLQGQLQQLRTSVQASGLVPAQTAVLLLAWFGGHAEALAVLEDIEPRMADLHSGDYVGGVRLLLGARPE